MACTPCSSFGSRVSASSHVHACHPLVTHQNGNTDVTVIGFIYPYMHRLTAHHDAQRRHKDTNGETNADPSKHDNALVTLEEEEGDEEDDTKDANIEEEHDLGCEQLGFFGRIDEVHDDVDGLDHTAGGVDGDEEGLVRLDQCIENP